MKSKTSYVCQECGYEFPKFLGRCPECGQWNTLREFKVAGSKLKVESQFAALSSEKTKTPKKLSEIKFEGKNRLLTGYDEVDNVLGGGLVKGSATLLAGDPGIGKSTLLLQVGLNLSQTKKVLYISGEESEEQIKMRALRINKNAKNNNFFLVSLNNTDQAFNVIVDTKPEIVIVDSIQTMESENLSGLSGSVGQVRYAALSFIKIAKTLGIPVILVGHVTKEGMVAGTMVLSHMVDTVLFFEVGLSQVKDAEHLFMSSDNLKTPGSVLTVAMEGTRPFLVEIQALTVFSKFPMPKRVANGIDGRRLEPLIAVLQKQVRVPVENMDIFV